jgi:hypothetical protein
MGESRHNARVQPAQEYSRRLAAREDSVRRLEGIERGVGAVRLLLALIAPAIAWASWVERRISPGWLLVPAAAFGFAVARHHALRRRRARAARAASFYRRGLERLADRWAGTGPGGERFEDPHHVYSADLDLFGEGSLFQLLCEARTRVGEETLASWLLAPAAPGTVRERQQGVDELRARLDLREDLAVLGEGGEAVTDPRALRAWAESPNVLGSAWIRALASGLPLLLLVTLLWWAGGGDWIPAALVLALEALALQSLGGRIAGVLRPLESAFDSADIRTLAGLLARIERERFESTPLRGLMAACASGALPASGAAGRLATIVALSESRENPAVRWFLAVPLLHALQVARLAERWRAAHGGSVARWLRAAGELEALSSLARYAFEHADDPFPRLIDGPASLRASGIGHPLIPAARCVRNDVEFAGGTRVLLVSGSNMSGKSTLLRALGLNTVLAMAGAPVRARSLELTALEVGASIRINDSLREGSSRFYAEITRLRQIRELAGGALPVLFLLDEILQGTNSSDRRIGAQGILRALLARGAIGVATTHDLALTALGGFNPGALRNVHFEDHMEGGRMRFDFRLREGVVTKSNGLELMRAMGLEV